MDRDGTCSGSSFLRALLLVDLMRRIPTNTIMSSNPVTLPTMMPTGYSEAFPPFTMPVMSHTHTHIVIHIFAGKL